MIGTSETHATRRIVRPALVALALAVAAAGQIGPAGAQEAGAHAAPAQSSLPYTVGRVHRNEAGRIVPDLRPAPETEFVRIGAVHPAPPGPAGPDGASPAAELRA